MVKFNKYKDPLGRKLPVNTVAIDPGKSGRIVVTFATGIIWDCEMPIDPKDFKDLLKFCKLYPTVCFVEKLHAMPRGMRGVNSTWKLSQNQSMLLTGLVFSDIMIQETPPKEWQRFFSMIKKKGEDDTSWKNRLKAKAVQEFPNIKVTLKNADALLISAYARQWVNEQKF
jgi:hypothetical protein